MDVCPMPAMQISAALGSLKTNLSDIQLSFWVQVGYIIACVIRPLHLTNALPDFLSDYITLLKNDFDNGYISDNIQRKVAQLW